MTLVRTGLGDGPADGWELRGERRLPDGRFEVCCIDLGPRSTFETWPLTAWTCVRNAVCEYLNCPLASITWWMQPYWYRQEDTA